MRRLSPKSARIVRYLLADPGRNYHGYDIIKECDAKAGTVYRLLGNFTENGWMERTTEASPHNGRPPRKVYRITGQGIPALNYELTRFTEAGLTPA